MRPAYDVEERYIGAGNLADYTFSFKIEALAHLEVIMYNNADEEIHRVRGTDTSVIISSVDYDSTDGGGTVHLLANLPTDYTLILLLANDAPTQPRQYREKHSFTLRNFEMLFDFITGPVQRLFYLVKRGLYLPEILDPDDYNLQLPTPEAETVIGWNEAGDGLRNYTFDEITSAAGLADGTLALPTDGAYGSVQHGAIAGVADGDTYEDAFDKVEVILGKLAPAKPQDCADVTLVIAGSYSAYESDAAVATLRAVVTDDTTPTISHGTDPLTDGFYDGDAGTLTASMDSVAVGTIALTTADDTGTNGDLEIVTDSDPYIGIFGQQDFWKSIVAQINSAILTVGVHLAELTHSDTGTCSLTFYIDDCITPNINALSMSLYNLDTADTRYISGVPSLATGEHIIIEGDIDDAVGTYYNATRIARGSSTATSSVNEALPTPPPANGATISSSISMPVVANSYDENVTGTLTAYNSKGTTDTQTVQNGIRVDTVSNESSRYKSGTGQYPSQGSGAAQFGDAYVSTDLLSSNKELQLLNGLYQYPPAVDYTGNNPSPGPDYSALTPDAYANMRWVTFQKGTISSATSVTINLTGGINLGSSVLISNMVIQVRVTGATPTTGWVDANAAYPGVGSPTNNGDAALVVGSSTVSSRVVTFGASVKTGTVWVRIGIPSGSTKKLSGIS